MLDKFFLFGVLPPLEFGFKPEITSKELSPLLELNLGKGVLKKVKVLKMWIDLFNIYLLTIGGKFDSRGNYSKSLLKELISSLDELPDYLIDFLQKYETEEERYTHFREVVASYFVEEEKRERGALRKFLSFEHELRIVSGAFHAKREGRSIAQELQYEDMGDPIVAFCLAQEGGRGKFQFPYEYTDLEKKIVDSEGNPSKIREAFARYRFEFYAQFMEHYPFSSKMLLAYIMQLWILEEYYNVSSEEGLQILNQLIEGDHVS